MARSFVSASFQYLENAAGAVATYPITMACWFNPTTTAQIQCMLSLGHSLTTDRHSIQGDGASHVAAQTADPTTTRTATSTGTFAAGAWAHAAGVFASATSRTAYRDGGNSGTNTGNTTPANANRTNAGCRFSLASRGQFWNGLIAEAAIWNIALTAAEVAELAKGFSPMLIQPQNLVSYWPLLGRTSPEIDLRGGFPLSIVGPTRADHCRVFNPRHADSRFSSAATGDLPTLGALTATGGVGQATISQIVTVPAQIWGLIVARSVSSGFTPAKSDVVGIAPWISSPIIFADRSVPAGVYFYRTSAFINDGRQTAWTPEASATVL